MDPKNTDASSARIFLAGERDYHFTIGRKIALALLILLMLMTVIIGITIQGYNSVIKNLEATNKEASKQGAAGNVRFSIAQLIMYANDYIITEKEHYRFMFEQQRARVENYQKKLIEFELSSNELAITDSISANLDSIYVYADQIFTIPRPRSSPEASALMEIMDYTFGDAVNRKTTEIFDIVFNRIKEHRIQSALEKEQMLNTIYIVFFLGLMASLVVVYLVVKKIAKPITMVAKAADSIAKGDYSQRPAVSTRDEVGKLARSVSRMAEEIEGTHRNLEARKRFTENIVATVPSGLLVIGKESEVLSVNRSFCELFNVTGLQVVGKTVDAVLQTIGLSQKCRDAIAVRTPFRNLECTCFIAGKGELTLNLSLSGIRVAEEEEEEEEALIVIDDITERKRAELLRWRLSQVLESIAGDQALPQVLEGLVRAIEEYLPEIKGSVLLLDATGKRLRHGAAPSLPDDYNTAIDGLLIGPHVGSCGTAAYEKRLVIVEDIQTDPLWADFRDLAGKYGLRACWSQPIIDREGAVLGTLALYYQQPRKPTEAELELINTGAHIAGIAIKRKQAEEEIRQAHQQYEELVNSIDGIVWEADARTFQFSFVSKQAERLLGYPTERWITEPSFWKNHIHTDDREWVVSFCINATAEKKSHEFDYRMVAADGRVVWLRDIVVVVLKDEQPEMLRGVMIDITERKQAEEELKTLSSAVEQTADTIVITNRDGIIEYVNPAFEQLTGYSSQEAIGKTPRILKSGTKDRKYYEEMWETILSGRVFRAELVNKKKNGELYYEEKTITPIVDVNGNITHFVASGKDITARKLAEEKLRQSEEQFRLITENVADLITVLDLEGRRVYNSPSYKNILGDPNELLGTDSFQEIHPDDRDKIKAIFQETVRTGIGQHAEYRFIKKDGTISHIESQGSVIRDKDGKVSQVVVVSRDVTEKKQLEQQFMRMQRMESIGTLAGGVAHDLNNVLAPIMLAVEILRKSMSDERSQKMLETLEASTRRGSDIVKQILGFARGVEGERTLLQLRHIIEDTISIIKETFPKSISIKQEIPKNIWTILGDSTQLHQVIMNLCINARDAMPNGGTVKIFAENKVIDEQYARMHIEAIPGHYLMISVEDTGTGMPPDVVNRIFEPFFTTKERGKGTGLGLSTVHTIVKSHKGFINVYSEIGKGTTFKVYIPAAETEQVKASGCEIKELSTGNGELILVVDDEASICEITKQTLEAFGYRAITACDGTEALAIYASQGKDIALVITDMMMRYMDGSRTILALRKINPAVKIIASSGLNANGHVATDKDLGVDAFIVKPYNAEKLLEVIHSVLHKGS